MAGFPPNPQYTPPVDETTKRFVAQWTDWFAKIEQYITLTGAYGGGVLPASAGGTGFGSYAIGDLLYAATTTTLARLAGVATGNALISGGVGAAPAWGKIGLTTHVSGVLPAANGGTGVANSSTITIGGNVTFSGAFTFTGTITGNTTVTFPTTGTLATTAQLPTGANPSATIGLSAVNGSAATFMRSDGAPALGVGISPTWTGNHTFAPASGNTVFSTGNVGIGVTPGAKLDLLTGSTNRLRVSESASALFFDSLNAAASAWGDKTERATSFKWHAASAGTPSSGMQLDGNGKLNVQVGILPDGGGFKHARVTTGSVSAGTTALVTITWGTAFADANYTVSASVLDSTTSSASLSVVHVESVTASAVTVRVLNSAAGSLTGTVHVIAMHD